MNQDKINSLLDIRDKLNWDKIPNIDLFLDRYAVGDLTLTEDEKKAFIHDCNMLDRVEKRLGDEQFSEANGPQLIGSYWDANTRTNMPYFLNLNLTPGTEIIPDYTLISRLGKGGTGEVWLGKGPGDVRVAMKFIPPEKEETSSEDNEFRDEAMEIIRQVRYPHLLPIHGIWNNKNFRLIISSLADETLWDRFQALRKAGQTGIKASVLITWFRDIAITLDFLNNPNRSSRKVSWPILHGDIKPENIFLSGESILVGDLGQARIFKEEGQKHSGSLTVSYAAPECLNGSMHKNSDQYSLAVVWCVLCGANFPYGTEPYDILRRQKNNEPELSFFPVRERKVLKRALSCDPNARFSSCHDFVTALDKTFQPPGRFGLGFLTILTVFVMGLFCIAYWQYQLNYSDNSIRVLTQNESFLELFFKNKGEQKIDNLIVLSPEKNNFSQEGLKKALEQAQKFEGNTQIILRTSKFINRIPFDKEIVIEFLSSPTRNIVITGEGPQRPFLDAEEKTRHFFFKRGNILFRNISFRKGFQSDSGGSFLCETRHENQGNENRIFIDACDFYDNNSLDNGGAFCNKSNSIKINIKKTVFIKNRAACSAGALYLGGPAEIDDSEFSQNGVSDGNGGAVVTVSSLSMINSHFYDNESSERGGGLSIEKKGFLKGKNLVFHKNKAKNGGGLAILVGTSLVINSQFKENTATVSGGGMIQHDNSSSIIAHCIFDKNNAMENGGAYDNNGGTVSLLNSKVINNYAGANGGGIASGCSSYIYNCLIAKNHAVREGAIYSPRESKKIMRIVNSTIVDNLSHQSNYVLWTCGAVSEIFNSIIVNNKTSDNKEAVIDFYGEHKSVKISNCLVSSCSLPTSGIVFNYDSNKPLFKDPDKGDFSLASDSQAIGRGDNSYLFHQTPKNIMPYMTTDLSEKERIVNGIIDLGAYEYEFSLPSDGSTNELFDLKTIGDPPHEYLEQYAKIEKEVKASGGFAVAGQILYEGKIPAIENSFYVLIFYNNNMPEYVYCFKNGWFITKAQSPIQTKKWFYLDIADFTHRPNRILMNPVEKGNISFKVISLEKAQKYELSNYFGRVTDEDGNSLSDVLVSFRQFRVNYGVPFYGVREIETDQNGQYFINGIYNQRYYINFSKKNYNSFSMITNTNLENNIILRWPSQLRIDYEISDTNKFNGKNIVKNAIWVSNKKFRFEKNNTVRQYDLSLMQNIKGELYFGHFYINDTVSHYDAGEIPFEFISKADKKRLEKNPPKTPCLVDHVYVLRTLNGKYVKFIIHEIIKLKIPATMKQETESGSKK